jgi:ornithine--oxo-acid transaminase
LAQWGAMRQDNVMAPTSPQRTEEYIELEERYGAHNYRPLDVVISRGEGVWLYDVEGRRYLDCLAAYSAVNQGHCHPKIIAALVEQARRVTLTSRAFRNDQLPLLLQELTQITEMDAALLMNSGAEAVETAIKAARKWGYRVKGIPSDEAEVIVCRNNFHGRTIGIISASTEPQYRKDFGPFVPGFRVVPFGDLDALATAITPHTCAFLVEPIQGEAGVVIPPDGYLRAAAELCRKAGVLFIADEIQSGLGRTGRLLACAHEEVTPDGVVLGKALSGGCYPVSAFLARAEVMNVFAPGDHGSTFGGNPLACAVARAALQVLQEEHLSERAATIGAHFLQSLRHISSPVIRDVRGRGLWIGIELTHSARPYAEALMRKGVLCKETHDTILRIAPPLTIARSEVDWAVAQLADVLATPPRGEEITRA